MLRLAHTRLSHGANFREGQEAVPRPRAPQAPRVCVS